MNKELEKIKNQQQTIFTQLATMLGGISSPVRVQLLHFLSQGPLTVEVLSQKIDQSVANTSMHLRKMLACQLVSVSVMAQKRLYSLHPAVLEFWESCQNLMQKIDPSLSLDLQSVFGEEIEWKLDLISTLKQIKNGTVQLLDVRPMDEVDQDLLDLPVIHIPSSDLKNNLKKISHEKPVLVFCRGRLCGLSAHTVNMLRQNGYEAYRLNSSWYELDQYNKRKIS